MESSFATAIISAMAALGGATIGAASSIVVVRHAARLSAIRDHYRALRTQYAAAISAMQSYASAFRSHVEILARFQYYLTEKTVAELGGQLVDPATLVNLERLERQRQMLDGEVSRLADEIQARTAELLLSEPDSARRGLLDELRSATMSIRNAAERNESDRVQTVNDLCSKFGAMSRDYADLLRTSLLRDEEAQLDEPSLF